MSQTFSLKHQSTKQWPQITYNVTNCLFKIVLLWILKKYYQRRIYMYIHINRIIRPIYYNLAPSISIFNLKDRKAFRSLNFNLNTKSRRVITFFILKKTSLNARKYVQMLWIYRQSLLWRSDVQETCRHYFIL